MNLASGEKLAEIKGDKSAALIGANDQGLETAVKPHERGELGRVHESRHMVGRVEASVTRAGIDTADIAGITVENAGKKRAGKVHVDHCRGRRLPHVLW
jgi:hypothetical protein